ncbi:MAG: efflux RND transporter periplasmic adaptor subunit, partial [Gemmatimonadetes bacterium]|nr:efflux RND transporter periplasmic adaptor subunit [Gemmatimonadota bacterium]
PVIMGLNDWDYAEILAGLEEGEELAQIGAAQLQAQQQDRLNRMRGRMGGPFR